MDLPYNGGDNGPTKPYILTCKNHSFKNWLYLVELLAKGVSQTYQTNQVKLLPMPLVTLHNLESRTLKLQATLTYVIKHEEIELGPNQKLHPY